jgi:hypothetical protein
MPGFNPQTLSYRAQNANGVVVLIGDQPIAFAQTTSHRFAFGTEGLYGVGSAKPQEIQQLKIAPDITIDNFALTSVGENVIQNNVSFASIIANNQFNITVLDGINNIVKFTYVGCVARDFNETIAANRPITDAIAFDAMDVLDQTGQSILNGPNAFAVPSPVGQVSATGLGINIAASI